MEKALIPADRDAPMIFEAHRLKSFKNWPYSGKHKCTAQAMAEAGFFHKPTRSAPDAVQCFACLKEMEGWEPDDDPWKEHQDHSRTCEFVLLAKKERDLTVMDMLNILKDRRIRLFRQNCKVKVSNIKNEIAKTKANIKKLA